MPLIPIDLPPGFYKNGTPYSKRGRYENGSLVRYHDGSYRPIGGWQRRTVNATGADIAALIADPTLEAVRDIFSWRDNNQNVNTVFFSNLAVYHLSSLNVVTDITPAGYSAVNSSKDANDQRGYGIGPYGVGAYGVTTDLSAADVLPPDRWYSDNFGQVLLFGSIDNGSIYELDLGTLTTSVVTNAPTDVTDLCVTEERQVFVIGGGGQPRRLQASEVENRTNWTPATANQVIDRTLPGDGRLLRCIPFLDSVLLLGENDLQVARYIGPPYVYQTDELGTACGPIAAQAVAKTSGFVVWWGERNFWVYDGSLQQLECDVIDFLYADVSLGQVSKINCFTITDFSEVWWLYQSSGATEIDSYVVWDYRNRVWYTGRLQRTAGIDKGALLTPVMVDQDGQIFNHEQAGIVPSGEGDVFLETGPIDVQLGEKNTVVRAIYPDYEPSASLSYTLYARQFPLSTEISKSYTAANPTKTRIQGRSIRLRVDFTGNTAEHGLVRFDVSPIGGGQR